MTYIDEVSHLRQDTIYFMGLKRNMDNHDLELEKRLKSENFYRFDAEFDAEFEPEEMMITD